MRSTKLGLRALGLGVLGALSLVAFYAAGAQAAEFEINSSAANLLATFLGKQEGHGNLLVAGRNLKLLCAEGHITGAIESKTDALAKAEFHKCTALNLKTGATLPCEVLLIKAVALILPVLHNNEPFVLLEEDEGQPFTNVGIHGTECPLPLENPVKGTIGALVDNNLTAHPLLLFSEPIQLLLGDKLTFGGFPAYLDASVEVLLTGAHSGMTLGVIN